MLYTPMHKKHLALNQKVPDSTDKEGLQKIEYEKVRGQSVTIGSNKALDLY